MERDSDDTRFELMIEIIKQLEFSLPVPYMVCSLLHCQGELKNNIEGICPICKRTRPLHDRDCKIKKVLEGF